MSQKKGAKGGKNIKTEKLRYFTDNATWRDGRIPWAAKREGLKSQEVYMADKK